MSRSLLNGKYKKTTKVVCKQGMFPFSITDTAVNIMNLVVKTQEELDLICAFDVASSQTLEQLTAASGFMEKEVEKVATGLAKEGLIFNQPNSKGIMIYRLMPLVMIGLIEYKFMTKLTGNDQERELAKLFEALLGELRIDAGKNRETMLPRFTGAPALDRTVPARRTEDGKKIRVVKIDQALDTQEDFVLPSQTIKEIIDKFDDIAVGYCFCRQRRSLLGDHCTLDAPALNCFTFGKSARHTIAQGFATKTTKEKALEIMKEAENAISLEEGFRKIFVMPPPAKV